MCLVKKCYWSQIVNRNKIEIPNLQTTDVTEYP